MDNYKISIWGTSQTGKTTYLAMLYHAALERPDEWIFEEGNPAADTFIKDRHQELFVQQTFPKPTEGHHEYEYIITRRAENKTLYSVRLAFNDIAGEVYEWFHDDSLKGQRSDIGAIVPSAWFERISNSDGLLMLLDPSWNVRSKDKTYNTLIMDFLRQLRKQRKRPTDDADYEPRLHDLFVALCLTKADAEHWDKLDNWVCSRGTEQECRADCPVRGLMPDFMDKHINGIIVPEHVRCFLVSAIGRNASNEPNVTGERRWTQALTPPPPALDIALPAGLQSRYTALQDKLKDLQPRLVQTATPTTDTVDYFPSTICSAADIHPMNLLQPIEWIIEQLRQAKSE